MEPYIGEIRLFGGNYAPENWLLCDGEILMIRDYTALYAVIGTNYGGDGTTTFGLPDLRGRVPVGYGHGPVLTYTWRPGQKSGLENVNLDLSSMPMHSHNTTSSISVAIKATRMKGKISTPEVGTMLAAGDNKETTPKHSMENYISPPTPDKQVALKGASINSQIAVSNTGGNAAHPNMQPWLAATYIICWNGDFPPRA